MNRFAKILKKLRKEKNMRQEDLANELGYARTTIANYEQATRFPPINTLFEIADYFNVSLDYLLGRTKIKTSLHKLVLDNFEIPVILINPKNGKIIDFNQSAIDFYGYNKKEFENTTIFKINQIDNNIIEDRIKKALCKETQTFHFIHKLANGNLKNVFVFSGPVTLHKKKILYSAIFDFSKSDDSIINLNQISHIFLKIFKSKFPFFQNHHDNVCKISDLIAQNMNFDKKDLELLNATALIHDISFLLLPNELLSKINLNQCEYNLIKEHPNYGYELLNTINLEAAEIIKQHHERLDGTGYPEGLKGEEIRIEARIIAVADVFAAMHNDRPYRKKPGRKKAIEELKQNRNVKYDPEVVDICIRLAEEGKFDFL